MINGLVSFLTEKMNSPEVQVLIARANAQRDSSLVLMEDSLQSARMAGAAVGVLFIDLDKTVTAKQHGYSVKTRMIEVVHQRLRLHHSSDELVFHMGGDEFILIKIDCPDETLLQSRGDAMRALVKSEIVPVESDGCLYEFTVTASVGLCFYSGTIPSAPDVFCDGLSACHNAKEAGRDRCEWRTGNTKVLLTVPIEDALHVKLGSLAKRQNRPIEDLAREALWNVLRRYHQS